MMEKRVKVEHEDVLLFEEKAEVLEDGGPWDGEMCEKFCVAQDW